MAQDEPPSPCNRACTLDPSNDTCLGCYRTLKEIMAWSGYSADEKRAVLAQLDARKRRARDAHARKP